MSLTPMSDLEITARDLLSELVIRLRKLTSPTALRLVTEVRTFMTNDDTESVIYDMWYAGMQPDIAGRLFQGFSAHVEPDVAHECIQSVFPDYAPPKKQSSGRKTKEKDGISWDVDDKNRIRPNENNFLLAMEASGISFRYNEFTAEGFVDGLDGFGPRLSDAAYGELYLLLPRRYGFKVTREDIRDMVRSQMLQNKFHPVRDYLNGLEWDGVERLDEWLCTYAGAQNTPFIRAAGSLTLIAAVRRIRQPGCKFDEMLILESPEGRDKSSAFRLLAGEDHFSDHAPFGVAQREVIESLHGRWIVECPDLDTMSRAEVNSMKAFLSRQVDRAAMKYDRETTALPRHCIFVGTTNEESYLISKTGNRRYWPVRVERFDLEALAQDRDQLWAEAAWREAKGESIRLGVSLWEEARLEQEKREVGDELEEVVRDWLDDTTNLKGGCRTTIVMVAKSALHMDTAKISSADQKRVSNLLKRVGWFKASRSDGKNWWEKRIELS